MKNRNTINMLPTILLAVGFFALLPTAQALTPAPDGGYPGGNTAEGQNALASLDTSAGIYNTAVGIYSLLSLTNGKFCTAVGGATLLLNTADQNTAVGAGALLSNTTGTLNTANGAFALYNNTEGDINTANGANALGNNTTGTGNTAVGTNALFSNTASFNTAVGNAALLAATGGENTAVGADSGGNIRTAINVICIGWGVAGANENNSCYIGNIWNQPGGSQAVYVNSEGKLGALVSSRRFKDEIQPMEHASEVIYALKPVSFRYKAEIEPTRPRGFGLIAEEVEKVSPELVTRSSDGNVNSVRYDQVNAMLLNEFLKDHKKVEAQQIKISQQQATIEELESTVARQQREWKLYPSSLKSRPRKFGR